MSVDSIGGNYGNVYSACQESNIRKSQIYDLNNTQTDVFATEKKSNKAKTAGVIGAVALGAAAIATTAYALKKGKANLGKDAKLGEALVSGFRTIGSKIVDGVKGLFGKGTKSLPQDLQDAHKAVENAKVPQDFAKLKATLQEKGLEYAKESISGSPLYATSHSAGSAIDPSKVTIKGLDKFIIKPLEV